MGALFLAPLYLQEGRGYSALQSGLTTFPEAVGVILFSQIAARLYPIVGPRRLMVAGLALVTAVLIAFSFAGGHTNLWLIRLTMFGIGVGMSNQILSLQACAYATITSPQTGHASAIFNTQRQVATACAVALLGTVLAVVGGHGVIVKLSAFHVVFLVDAALAACGSLVALRIHDEDALNTMNRKRKDEDVSLETEAMASA
jgi:MFS family permease